MSPVNSVLCSVVVCNLYSSPPCHTVSKAFCMSRVAMREALFCLLFSCNVDVIVVIACCVDLPCLKPNWSSVYMLWCSLYCVSLFVKILSNVLHSVSNSEMGL